MKYAIIFVFLIIIKNDLIENIGLHMDPELIDAIDAQLNQDDQTIQTVFPDCGAQNKQQSNPGASKYSMFLINHNYTHCNF